MATALEKDTVDLTNNLATESYDDNFSDHELEAIEYPLRVPMIHGLEPGQHVPKRRLSFKAVPGAGFKGRHLYAQTTCTEIFYCTAGMGKECLNTWRS